MKPALAELLQNPLLWRGDQLARTHDAVSSGFAELDSELPGSGWPKSVLTELAVDAKGIGELSLLLPALKRLAQGGEWIMLLAPPHIPYAPAFSGRGIDPGRVVLIEAEHDKDRWWAAEQVLRANSAGALLFWPETSADQRMRRLQIAAQEGQALAFVFTSLFRAEQPSSSPLRIRLSPSGDLLKVDIFKRRGGVVSRPLLLDVKGTDHDYQTRVPAMNNRGLSLNDRRPSPISPRTPSHRYAIRTSPARIWSHALARADEVRRRQGPDPREQAPRNETTPVEPLLEMPTRISPRALAGRE